MMRDCLLLICVFLLSLGASPLLAHPKTCTSDEIAKLARGGFTDLEIREFCILAQQSVSTTNLREKYAMLEGKNWSTHYYLSQDRQQREEVFFQINENVIQLTSSNPNVQYFDINDLGDTLRFKRRQNPYKAIYTLTLALNQMTASKLPVVQQYKKVKHYTWIAK